MKFEYGIITPTFEGHFPFIRNYLKSFDTYVIDKKDIPLFFIINKEEEESFKKIIEPYRTLNIKIVIFDEVLDRFNVFLSPNNLLKKYGKFSFQTLKKFYAMLYVDVEKFLVLDSESMWVRETNMKKLFRDFFSKPKLFCSNIKMDRMSSFRLNVQRNIDYLLQSKNNLWFLENFMWYYDRVILKDMFNEIGSPIEIVEKSYQRFPYSHDVFEILLYQNYLYQNRIKYQYDIINVYKKCQTILSKKVWENYYFELTDRLHGDFGILEQTMLLLNKDNVDEFSELFKNLSINIIRCETGNNIQEQKKFIEIVTPFILAASQDHSFGISRVGIISFLMQKLNKLNFFSREHIKYILRKIDPAYKVACENREYLFRNQMLLNDLIEYEKERKVKEVDKEKMYKKMSTR